MNFLEMMHAESLREAAALLARRGYDNVQAAGLAEAMRMSVGSLYRRYGSKLGLALAVRDFTEKELSYQADVAFLLKHGKPGVDFAQAFFVFWWELAWWALTKPDFFNFTFLHWHAHEYGPHSPPAPAPRVAGALIPQQSYGGATRALVREVLEKGEREGALAPGCVPLGEGLVWGALMELARAAWQGAQVGEADVRTSARALWRALAREQDAGPRGSGTPSPGEDSGPRITGMPSQGGDGTSPGTPDRLAMAPSLEMAKVGSEHREAGEGGEPVQGIHAGHRVATCVESGAPHAQAAAVGDDGLAGQADAVGELSGGVIGATGERDHIHLLDLAPGKQSFPAGALAMAGEEAAGTSQLRSPPGQGALPEGVRQPACDGVLHVAVAGHEVGQGGVAVAVLGLRGGDDGVEVQRAVATLRAEEVAQHAPGIAGEAEQPVGDDERPLVDERVARDGLLVRDLDQRVEGIARGLLAHPAPDGVSVPGQCKGQREDLGDLRARLHARPLLGEDELSAGEALSPDAEEEGDLEREDMLPISQDLRLESDMPQP